MLCDRLSPRQTDHLKSFEYLDSDCEQMKQISARITRLRNKNTLEDAAVKLLKHLGEVKRSYLTPLEEKMLSVLEKEYGQTQSKQQESDL